MQRLLRRIKAPTASRTQEEGRTTTGKRRAEGEQEDDARPPLTVVTLLPDKAAHHPYKYQRRATRATPNLTRVEAMARSADRPSPPAAAKQHRDVPAPSPVPPLLLPRPTPAPLSRTTLSPRRLSKRSQQGGEADTGRPEEQQEREKRDGDELLVERYIKRKAQQQQGGVEQPRTLETPSTCAPSHVAPSPPPQHSPRPLWSAYRAHRRLETSAARGAETDRRPMTAPVGSARTAQARAKEDSFATPRVSRSIAPSSRPSTRRRQRPTGRRWESPPPSRLPPSPKHASVWVRETLTAGQSPRAAAHEDAKRRLEAARERFRSMQRRQAADSEREEVVLLALTFLEKIKV